MIPVDHPQSVVRFRYRNRYRYRWVAFRVFFDSDPDRDPDGEIEIRRLDVLSARMLLVVQPPEALARNMGIDFSGRE